MYCIDSDFYSTILGDLHIYVLVWCVHVFSVVTCICMYQQDEYYICINFRCRPMYFLDKRFIEKSNYIGVLYAGLSLDVQTASFIIGQDQCPGVGYDIRRAS